jgi:hypothetical protein
MTRPIQSGLAFVFASLLVAAVFSYWQSRAVSATLAAEQRDARACVDLAAEIEELRALPQFAVLEEESEETILGHIEQAAESVSLQSALVGIQPIPLSYLGDSPYRIRAIRLDLRSVSLEQIVSFAHQLADENRGMTIRDLEFWQFGADRRRTGPELWNAKLTLTQLIFSPMRRQSG